MGKLLRIRDILLLTLAGIGDVAHEIKDPMQIMGKSYEAMYGFIPNRYKRSNFLQTVRRTLKTGNIEKVIKNGEVYLRLTSRGTKNLHRDFPILNLTKKWDKRWVIVVFDISEKSKSIRNNLRNKLKSLGFGMLQKSIWISPLSITEDMREFIDSIGLSEYVFVMEVSGFILGDPKELARRVWNLDSLEKEFMDLKLRIEQINQLVRIESDRINKREAKAGKEYYQILRNKREAMREKLEFIVQLPLLPKELVPTSLRDLFSQIKDPI
jgi:phenylacetic acid degradation operon negative regulatory protein